ESSITQNTASWLRARRLSRNSSPSVHHCESSAPGFAVRGSLSSVTGHALQLFPDDLPETARKFARYRGESLPTDAGRENELLSVRRERQLQVQNTKAVDRLDVE